MCQAPRWMLKTGKSWEESSTKGSSGVRCLLHVTSPTMTSLTVTSVAVTSGLISDTHACTHIAIPESHRLVFVFLGACPLRTLSQTWTFRLGKGQMSL